MKLCIGETVFFGTFGSRALVNDEYDNSEDVAEAAFTFRVTDLSDRLAECLSCPCEGACANAEGGSWVCPYVPSLLPDQQERSVSP